MNERDAVAAYDVCLSREDTAGARACLTDALSRAENDRARLTLYNELMGFERQYGSVENSVAAAEAALALLRTLKLTDSKPAAFVWLNAATVYKNAGMPADASSAFDRADACFTAYYPPGAKEFAGLYNNRAALDLDLGDDRRAEYWYGRAAALLRRWGDRCDLAVTLLNLASLENRCDPLSGRAAPYADEGLALLEQAPESERDPYYYYTCRKCAGAAEELGLFAAAWALRERADAFYARA